jgi:hypothetical protein
MPTNVKGELSVYSLIVVKKIRRDGEFVTITIPQRSPWSRFMCDPVLMKEIRVLKREGHALTQDVADCVSTLKQADIWAHAGVLEFPGWRIIAIISKPAEATAILRSKGFHVVENVGLESLI